MFNWGKAWRAPGGKFCCVGQRRPNGARDAGSDKRQPGKHAAAWFCIGEPPSFADRTCRQCQQDPEQVLIPFP